MVERPEFFVSLFEWCNRVSAQYHEDSPLVGRVCFLGNDSSAATPTRLKRGVSVTNYRAIGKLIMSGTPEHIPVVVRAEVVGFGHLGDRNEGRDEDKTRLEMGSVVEFRGRGSYRWWYRGRPVLDVTDGQPTVPVDRLTEIAFNDEFDVRFPGISPKPVWDILSAVADDGHGATVIVTANAAAEAERLDLGFALFNSPIAPEAVRGLSRIDGGLLLDSGGHIHAFGVFLDGLATPGRGQPARGSRYNSALQYCSGFYAARKCRTGLLVAVISQDGMIDLIGPEPLPDPPLKRR
ncbi:MAG: hypothetical protein U0791_06810 [Gemmataceae bacterium]